MLVTPGMGADHTGRTDGSGQPALRSYVTHVWRAQPPCVQARGGRRPGGEPWAHPDQAGNGDGAGPVGAAPFRHLRSVW